MGRGEARGVWTRVIMTTYDNHVRYIKHMGVVVLLDQALYTS